MQLAQIIRRRTAATKDGPTTRDPVTITQWRSRAALAGVVAVCVVATTLAVTTAGANSSGQKFLQSGHLIYNSTVGAVFHIDGGAKQTDGLVPVPGLAPGTQAVQSDTEGFVLARGSITSFEKSTLQVDAPKVSPSDEVPVGLAAAGVAYAVYRAAGSIVRLGPVDRTLSDNGALGQSAVAPDGTLWVHRLLTRELCYLAAQADQLTCPAELPRGNIGSLTVVGDQVMFVDTTASQLRTVSASGLGRPQNVPGLALSPQSIVAPNDVDGRIAIVEPDKSRLHLVDAGAANGPVAIEKPLPAGKFTQIASSGHNLALVDEAGTKLLTLDADGNQKANRPIPKPSGKVKQAKDDRPLLVRGADQRLYVDSVGGEQALVVDRDGSVSQPIPVSGPTKTPTVPVKPSTTPPPSTTSKPPVPDPSVPPRSDPSVPPQRTTNPGDRPTRTPPRQADPPRRTEPTRRPTDPPRTTQPPTPKPPPPLVATPAAAPRSLRATGGNGRVTLTWTRPSLNGGTFVRYNVVRVSDGGSSTTTSTRYTSTGLQNGTRYTFQVRTVTRDANGKTLTGAAATVSASTTAATPTIRITKGPLYDGADPCDDTSYCYLIHIVARGFKPNTTYRFYGYTSNYGELHNDTLTTNSSGAVTVNKFYNDDKGGQVWVTAVGQGKTVESNRVTW
ncbi:fibronectin type III domain-containing protein [Kribbella sp. NPDC005582]|uniref:fibronectin type III domain-containing protein n=1 Tax=Kribbella sp. NPDC005582 TaxID=3156893 RepID=UPI0033B5C8D7